MMRQYELVERVLAYNPQADEDLLNKAYVYAMKKHGSQKRASGDPYFAHPLEVAAILTDLKLDDSAIAVALLHDTIEDTDATRTEIDEMFGPEIGEIVDGLTKIERLNLVSREDAQAENLRKLMLAISQDVRVLLVKLGDRLHNMRTISFVPPQKRKRIAQETMEIYAPLAGRMGMQEMRSELETISFSVLQPGQYEAIKQRLNDMETDNAHVIEAISQELDRRLQAEGIKGEVKARLKAPWSIYRKIEDKSIAFEQLSDVIGFRIIVESVGECYRALGVVHNAWQMVPGRFKDYISVPKYNEYRSIHTTIVGPERHRVELQIRSQEMHRIAEYGIAAHALYKEGGGADLQNLENESQAYARLRTTIEHLTSRTDNDDKSEFVEFTKLELFQDQVFCFTPRGRLIALPRGATPVDFAYAVHTDIGDTCVGAKINGVFTPVITQLRNGDEVEILRDHNHAPPANWESIAVTGKARAAIRRSIRHHEQEKAYKIGRDLLSRVLEQYDFDDINRVTVQLAEQLEYTETQDFCEALGRGEIEQENLLVAIAELGGKRSLLDRFRRVPKPEPMQKEGWFALRGAPQFNFRIPGGQNVKMAVQKGLNAINFNTPVAISPEGVLPGDRLVGIFHKGFGKEDQSDFCVEVHPIQSNILSTYHDADVAWIDVIWDPQASSPVANPVTISIYAAHKPGMLAQASAVIASADGNVANLVLRTVSPDFHQIIFQVEMRDVVQLQELLAALKQLPGITNVRRADYAEATALANIDQAET